MPNERQKLLAHTHSLIRQLEKKRKSKIFMFVEVTHEDHICFPQRNLVFSKKAEFDNIDTLEIFLHSGGGHAEFAYQIAKFFRRHCKQLNFIVPIAAKSAATLMCLVGDTIFMGERAELGSLDVQITDPVDKGLDIFAPIDEFKSMEFLKEYSVEILDYFAFALHERTGMSVKEAFHEAMPAVANLMNPLYQKIDPSKIGNYRRSLAVAEEYAKRLLKIRGVINGNELAETLVWKYPSHDFVIDRYEASELGMPIAKLDVAQDDLCFEIIQSIYNYEESIYAFAENNKPKRATTKKRVSKPKTPAVTRPAAKSAVA